MLVNMLLNYLDAVAAIMHPIVFIQNMNGTMTLVNGISKLLKDLVLIGLVI